MYGLVRVCVSRVIAFCTDSVCVQDSDKWADQWCVLKGGFFYVFPAPDPAAASAAAVSKTSPLATVDLSSCQVQRADQAIARPHAFVISHLKQERHLFCVAEDEDEQLAWLVELQGCQAQLTARGRINNVFANKTGSNGSGSSLSDSKRIVSLRKALPRAASVEEPAAANAKGTAVTRNLSSCD